LGAVLGFELEEGKLELSLLEKVESSAEARLELSSAGLGAGVSGNTLCAWLEIGDKAKKRTEVAAINRGSAAEDNIE
jgi:hypothetical protein